MSERAKWLFVLFGIVAFTVVGLTALDGYDEETCRQTPAWTVTEVRNPVHDPNDPGSGPPAFYREEPEICDGFLPW